MPRFMAVKTYMDVEDRFSQFTKDYGDRWHGYGLAVFESAQGRV